MPSLRRFCQFGTPSDLNTSNDSILWNPVMHSKNGDVSTMRRYDSVHDLFSFEAFVLDSQERVIGPTNDNMRTI